MSNKWFWGLLVLFLVGGLSAGLLYRRYIVLQQQPLAQLQGPDVQYFGSLIVSYTTPNPQQKEYLRVVTLNNLAVDDYGLDVVKLGKETKPVLNLSLSFEYQGKKRTLVIPVVDSVLVSKAGVQGFEDEGEKSVTDLNFSEDAKVNVVLFYLPKGNLTRKRELVKYCESYDQFCSRYIQLGFGDEEIDFGSYLEGILGDQEIATIDYKLAFLSAVFILSN